MNNFKKKVKAFDHKIFGFLSTFPCKRIYDLLSYSGSFIFLILVVILLFFMPYQSIKFISFILLVSLILNTFIVFILKYSLRRKRISFHNKFMKNLDPYSFPSGHISRLSGFSSASIFFPMISILFLILALAAAISRIIKGYHYASDCLIGFLIGAINGFLALYISEKFLSGYFYQIIDKVF